MVWKLFVLLILLITGIHEFYRIFVSPEILDPFPSPKHTNGHRTAIAISGDLRGGNITFQSKNIYILDHDYDIMTTHGLNTPTTPIQTFLEWLVQPIAKYGGVDLFIYFPVKQSVNIAQSKLWNGNPLTYEPYAGDTRACKLYSENPMFYSNTGNKVFCLSDYEVVHSNLFVKKYWLWSLYFDKKIQYNNYNAWELFLQQEYGKYIANIAIKQYSLVENISYAYKIRTRPDMTPAKPFPGYGKLIFHGINTTHCSNTTRRFILYPSRASSGYSGVDSFNIGYASDMDYVLDRYMDILTKPMHRIIKSRWNSEMHLVQSIARKYGVCLIPNDLIPMHKVRTLDYTERIFNRTKEVDWVMMSSNK